MSAFKSLLRLFSFNVSIISHAAHQCALVVWIFPASLSLGERTTCCWVRFWKVLGGARLSHLTGINLFNWEENGMSRLS